MTDNASGRRAATEATRVPPVAGIESLTIHPIADDMPTSPNPVLPADARLDAVCREIKKRMAAGGRMAEVVKRLRAIHDFLEIDAQATRQRADSLRDLITFAETGE